MKIKELIIKYKFPIMVIAVCFITSISTFVITKSIYNKNKQVSIKEHEYSNKKESKKTLPELKKESPEEKNEQENTNSEGQNNNTNSNHNTDQPINENIKNEEDVVNYFLMQEKLVSTSDQNNVTLREKIKIGFNTINSFLFHGGTINGYTFGELTSATKIKVLKIALSIDNKIDSYFPNYKDAIKSTASNIKSKIIVLYLDTTSKICSSHEEICSQAREDFNVMKRSFKISFGIIKDVVINSTGALKEWYLSK